MSSPPLPPPSPPISDSSRAPASIQYLRALLRQTLRITVKDGRIFIGTFVGTDQPLNILLINAEEFRLGPEENPNGRYVGQVMIPWKLVVRVEAQGRDGVESNEYHSDMYQ
ncbi:hypothetical protein PLICRDRAFT_46686 [Plicaturopsis crispa FD-325 SS-3]|uniref:Sm domain-containing protein n=1 Tax=Plicaturopsis crispa FD-325 SS-3 TaxID=944288 RepID=A0A0C9T3L6_PLICR|nr:hypothetical protein PLICRDRAFT_46686 [Plicaturopsis crispa FD-325 SS-3]